jgi:hypothetical protein
MRKFSVILLTAVVVFGAAVFVIACEGGNFIDPGHNDVYGLGSGGGGDTDGGGKPAKLSSNATHTEAIAKLEEIISYSETSSGIKAEAELLKMGLEGMSSQEWNYMRSVHINSINAMIEMID